MNNIGNKYCAIDIGTNSIRTLIAEIHKNDLNIIKKEMEMTRIGKGIDRTGLLSSEGIDATIEALKRFKADATSQGVVDINAIATSAVRDAVNRAYFLRRVQEEVDIEVEVIDGQKEAELGFKGIIGGMQFNGNILAVDIGGGSTELILGSRDGIEYSTSINIGAVRLTDKFITTDPIISEEVSNLENGIKEYIDEPLKHICKYSIDKVVGIGGTITTLGAVKQEMEVYDRNKIHNFKLDLLDIEKISKDFIVKNNNERKMIKGL